MSKEEHEEEQEHDLDSYLKIIDGEPSLLHNYGYKLTPQTLGESYFTLIDYNDYTEKFEERDSDWVNIKIFHSSGSYDVKLMHPLTEKEFQPKFEILETIKSKTIKGPDLTEIVLEKKNMKTLIETNQFLVLKNDELTKDLKILTKNYEILTKETKDEIISLKNRIGELIESKVSISRTPSYWVDEVFSEEFERENVEE